jgi:CMP-N-acetylneuraminic acid synthetase
MKIVAVIPIKLNNERVPGKNIKCFSDGTPLIRCIQSTLKKSKLINEIYVYCSKETIRDYLVNDVLFLQRDRVYDNQTATMNDILYAFSNDVNADIYVLAHATAPFLKTASIDKGIEAIVKEEYDSVVSVEKMQEFIWQDDKPFNYDIAHIPRTQDLPPLFIETTGLYIFKRDVIQSLKTRIGKKPLLLEISKIEAIDINYPDDFEIADAVYTKMLMSFSMS